MLAEISAGLSSLKTMKDLVQGMNAAKGEAAINSVKIELQGLILDAQQGLFAAQEAKSADANRIAELEQEIMRLKDWSREKERYELKRYYPGALAYALKKEMAAGEPMHRLCANCFQKGFKSIVQAQPRVERGIRVSQCPSCKTEFAFGEEMEGGAEA